MPKLIKRMVLIACLTLAVWGGGWARRAQQAAAARQNFYFVPAASAIRPLLLGYEQAAADLIWMRALGYGADEIIQRGSFKFLEPLCQLIVGLDRRFEKAYIWGGLLMSFGGVDGTVRNIAGSNKIYLRGIEVLQSADYWPAGRYTWRIPFGLGFNYWYEMGDRVRGAFYINMAASLPNAPPFIRTLPATLLMKEGLSREAISLIGDNLTVESIRSRLAVTEDEGQRGHLRGLLLYYLRKTGQSTAQLDRLLQQNSDLEQFADSYRGAFDYLPFGQYLSFAEGEQRWPEPGDGRRLNLTGVAG